MKTRGNYLVLLFFIILISGVGCTRTNQNAVSDPLTGFWTETEDGARTGVELRFTEDGKIYMATVTSEEGSPMIEPFVYADYEVKKDGIIYVDYELKGEQLKFSYSLSKDQKILNLTVEGQDTLKVYRQEQSELTEKIQDSGLLYMWESENTQETYDQAVFYEETDSTYCFGIYNSWTEDSIVGFIDSITDDTIVLRDASENESEMKDEVGNVTIGYKLSEDGKSCSFTVDGETYVLEYQDGKFY